MVLRNVSLPLSFFLGLGSIRMLPLCFAFVLALATSCASGEGQAPTRPVQAKGVVLPEDPNNPEGRALYIQHCKLCHGVDGQMGGSGAANLAVSLLTVEEGIHVVTNGRNLMQAYKERLSAEEIDAVVRYIQLFKGE
jgi:mono/diheme cytochrome c family protein